MKLRQYQWEAARFAADHLLNGAPAVGIVAPTGAGKSTIITALLNMILPRKVCAFVAPPQKAIERGFRPEDKENAEALYPPDQGITGKVSAGSIGTNAIYTALRGERSKRNAATGILEGNDKDRCALTTHQQMAYWDVDFLLDDMTDRILVLDEAHHAGTTDEPSGNDESDKIGTKLGVIAQEWQARGGQVVYVTATPYRNDGKDVIPDGAPTHTWTIAQHSEGGFAPRNFSLGTVPSGVEVSSPDEYAGEDLPDAEAQGGTSYDRMVDQWVADGKPKSVFVVPAKNSLQWAENLERALTQAGARVCNAVGTDAATDARFAEALNAEREAVAYAESTVDVFIACKRFDEGTDWPLCSHVYQWGVPSSFGLIIQRWGRAFRVKSRYADYPSRFREDARLTFFIPKIRAGAEDKFKQKHHEHSWLLGTFLADWATGRQYHNSLRLRFDSAWAQRAAHQSAQNDLVTELFGAPMADAVPDDLVSELFGCSMDEVVQSNRLTPDERAFIEGEQATILPDKRRLDATLLVAEAEALLTDPETGAGPTAKEIVQALADRGFSEDQLSDVNHVLVDRIVVEDATAASALDALMGGAVQARDPLSGVIRKDLEGVFREIVNQYGNRTVPVAARVIGYVTQFTGETAIEVADRLRRALNKPDFTVEGLEQACRAYYAEYGEAPAQKSGDASKYLGWSEQWSNVNQCIKAGRRGLESIQQFGGLRNYCIHLGLKFEKTSFTVEELEQACRAYYDEHGEAPIISSGDASKYLGWAQPEQWANIDQCIKAGRRGLGSIKEFKTLRGYCIHLGLKDAKINFTVDVLERAVRAYHAEHGKTPNIRSGDASKYLGWPEGTENWRNVEACIEFGRNGLNSIKGFGGLHGYCVHLGLKDVKPDFTVEGLERAIRDYHVEHGEAPIISSGDASKYLGWAQPESWKNVNQCIKLGSRGLESIKELGGLQSYCIHLGLKDAKLNFTVEGLERAVRAYYAEHEKPPTQDSGDASKYLGWDEGTCTWRILHKSIEGGYRGLGILSETSLSQFCKNLGLRTPPFTVEGLERAVRAYHAEHGKSPSQTSGDASKYLGWTLPELWSNIDQCIKAGRRGLEPLQRFGRLRGYCVHLGLKDVKPTFTVDGLERAIRAYHTEHGKIPSKRHGDASKYLGWVETWMNVDECIGGGRRGLEALKGSSLSQFCQALGLK